MDDKIDSQAALEAVRQASLALTTDLDLNSVLQKVVDGCRALVHARYGALGVLDEEGKQIEQFITSGVTPEEWARIGPPPRGHGVLGVILREQRTLRINNLQEDSRARGVPAHHPVMHSFLGVPIISKGRVLGNLYLTDKEPPHGAPARPAAAGDGEEDPRYFSAQDQMLVEMFALQAAIAIEHAVLHRQARQLAIARERERFGMDLHDGIIQSIYAIGLMLDDTRFEVGVNPKEVRARIETAVKGLNDVITDIRGYITDLGSRRFRNRDLYSGLAELAQDVQANSFLRVYLDVDAEAARRADPAQSAELLHIAQEAIANVRKHAHASSIWINLGQEEGAITLEVRDNGAGFLLDQVHTRRGRGLENMRERAAELGGRLEMESVPGRGTRLVASMPTTLIRAPR